MLTTRHLFIIVATLVTVTGSASADEPTAQVSVPYEPAFATLDRGDGTSRLGVSLSYLSMDGSLSGQRADLFGQLVHRGGVGGYFAMPFSRLSGLGDSDAAVGNLELGGLFTWGRASERQFVFRGGVMLPTSNPDDLFVNVLAAQARLTDIASAVPDTTFARGSGSVLGTQGDFFYRVDVGLDIAVGKSDDFNADGYLRINVGGGARVGRAAYSAELATLSPVGAGGNGEMTNSLALSATWLDLERVRPAFSLIIPFDGGPVDNVLMLSVEGTL